MDIAPELPMTTVSFHFSAGDFMDVLRRHEEGLPQNYQTHDEAAKLFRDLTSINYRVNIYSFLTAERKEERFGDNCRIISLGADNYSKSGLLKAAVDDEKADMIIAHHPNPVLLNAALETKSRIFPVMANSENSTGLRYWVRKRRVAALLNNSRFELVSNHCFPATEQLARMGVQRQKLIAWDIARSFSPASRDPKTLNVRQRYEAFYAGSISELKGIADLIRAVALLRGQGVEVHCSIAGKGEVTAMKALAGQLRVSDLMEFVGIVENTRIIEMMAGADVVVVPSRKEYPEGFPLTLFEAIASRTPIVCSNHPVFVDIMIDGRNASVFRSGDPQTFAAALRRTLTDPVLYRTLSANATLTWTALQGPADWRTMIFKWIVEGHTSPWIRERMLTNVRPLPARPDAPSC
jgi:glycosyltransferase involved in cell wall biosynthesis